MSVYVGDVDSDIINYHGGFTSDKIHIDKYIIDKYLHNKKNGTFIEVGGNDGITQSNTYVLEKYFNFNGILVEPSKIEYNKSLMVRRCNIYNKALVSFDYKGSTVFGDFGETSCSLMSSIAGKRTNSNKLIEVEATTLQSILDELNIKYVDFFSLDVEGYELEVLKGIDFNKVIFDYILIEFNPNAINELIYFMDKNGYKFIENVSKYNHEINHGWDGKHNDYLFRHDKG